MKTRIISVTQFMYNPSLKFNLYRELLRDRGIDTRQFFLGMHEQPVFHKMGLFKGESYPVAERIAKKGLYLPSGLTLEDQQIEKVSEALKSSLNRY